MKSPPASTSKAKASRHLVEPLCFERVEFRWWLLGDKEIQQRIDDGGRLV